VDEVEYEHLEEGVFRGIVAMLLRGTVAPGQKLNQLALCAALSASRTPINAVLSRLEGMMVVEKLPHRGARVRRYSEAELSHLRQLLEVVGGLAVAELCEAGDAGALKALRAELRRRRREAGDPERAYRLLTTFTDQVADAFHRQLIRQMALVLLVHHPRAEGALDGLRRAFDALLAAVETGARQEAQVRLRAVVAALAPSGRDVRPRPAPRGRPAP
jgi:DNA-binding GntR family transcriptional regulator